MSKPAAQQTLDSVREYYGKVLSNTADLKTNACCTDVEPPLHHKAILSKIHDDVISRFYGCGSPIPDGLSGQKVLDLGCGTGRDVYLTSALVGEGGRVTGVDMTDEQLATARATVDYHTDAFGFQAPNVTFHKGLIEDLAGAGIADNSIDIVTSNCVVNLSPDKPRVFNEVFRVLKPGGELYFSDVYASRRIPDDLRNDPVLYGECLSGALYIEDFRRLMEQNGIKDWRVVEKRPITIENAALQAKIGHIDFYSITVRAFNISTLEDRCEDYGQAVRYKGSVEYCPYVLDLDNEHRFETGKLHLVCGNTYDMLKQTRFAEHFDFIGDKTQHFGLFDCGPVVADADDAGACC